jgi:hypothetical protein
MQSSKVLLNDLAYPIWYTDARSDTNILRVGESAATFYEIVKLTIPDCFRKVSLSGGRHLILLPACGSLHHSLYLIKDA